jgi:hypothetical protein
VNKSLAFTILLVAISFAPSPISGFNPAQNSNQDISMLFARQAEDPVRIVQASFGADNLLLDARLENKSHNRGTRSHRTVLSGGLARYFAGLGSEICPRPDHDFICVF